MKKALLVILALLVIFGLYTFTKKQTKIPTSPEVIQNPNPSTNNEASAPQGEENTQNNENANNEAGNNEDNTPQEDTNNNEANNNDSSTDNNGNDNDNTPNDDNAPEQANNGNGNNANTYTQNPNRTPCQGLFLYQGNQGNSTFIDTTAQEYLAQNQTPETVYNGYEIRGCVSQIGNGTYDNR